jgi:uncharacterized protein (TIGR03067 family)
VCRFVAFAVVVALAGAGGCAKKPPDDTALAQGEWTIADIEPPEGVTPDERREVQMLKEVTVAVRGDRVTVTHAKEPGTLSATFTLDRTKEPHEIDLTDLTVAGDELKEQKVKGTTRGIYKLEGDALVLALPLGDGEDLPRPAEFKPLADKANHRGVLVFHLKRK